MYIFIMCIRILYLYHKHCHIFQKLFIYVIMLANICLSEILKKVTNAMN